MRLTADERVQISQVISRHCPIGCEVYLYGSRTDDSKRGGDIDLLIVVAAADVLETARSRRLSILVDLHAAIGEQRIDLGIVAPDELVSDPFWRQVFPGAIKLAATTE